MLHESAEEGRDEKSTQTVEGGNDGMIFIWYFNLKNDVSEEDFVSKSKELFDYLEGKVEGLGSRRFYRHHYFGANPRTYQMHWEMREFGTWDRFLVFIENDAEGARLFQEWRKLVDMNSHYDEFVRQIL